jgi:hypothetical protein
MPTETTSKSMTLATFRAIVYAASDKSKTFSSLTLSEKCPPSFSNLRPKVLVKPTTPILLDDLMFICFDQGALDGLAQQGIEVPAVDMSIIDPIKLPQELKDLYKLVGDKVAAKKTKYVIVDTLTALDKKLGYYQQYVRGLSNPQDYYKALGNDHLGFHQNMSRLACPVIYLCHAKAPIDMQDAKQAQRKKALGQGDVFPDITGGALTAYKGDATFIFHVQMERSNEGDRFFFHQLGSAQADGKSRLLLTGSDGKVLEKLPADWRSVRKALSL